MATLFHAYELYRNDATNFERILEKKIMKKA